VLVTKREKRAWRSCEDLGVVSASLPPRIIEKCLASDRIVIETVVGKYCNHTPLHRKSMILERDLGLEISRATLDGWVLKVGELLIPMVAAMRRELIKGSYIQADETPVDVQTREGQGTLGALPDNARTGPRSGPLGQAEIQEAASPSS
jgi:transposase